jgi:hypothetical protein
MAMLLSGSVAFFAVLALDSHSCAVLCRCSCGACFAVRRCCNRAEPQLVTVEAEDEDVARERRRVEDCVAGAGATEQAAAAAGGGKPSRAGAGVVMEDPITILDLHKVYKTPVPDGSKVQYHVAVHRLTMVCDCAVGRGIITQAPSFDGGG